MKIIFIFLLGYGILAGAIALNVFASRIGLMSWFEFIKEPDKADLFSYIWLCIIYPLGLGLVAYLAVKVLNL
jgi:hypothetical protein